MPRNDLKAYTSVIARLPQALADQVKRYASEHRCAVSELIREGLEMRLEADVPARAPGSSRDAEVLQEVLHTIDALAHMLRTQIQDTVRETLPEVLQEVLHRESSLHTPVSEVLQEVLPTGNEVLQGHASDLSGRGITEVLPHSTAAAPPAVEVLQGHTEVLPFDTTKYRLGTLCPRNHDYHGTGQSLRKKNKAGGCLACDAESARARRQAKRQEVSA